MKTNEIYREQIGILKNEATHLWGSTFVLGGGAITLFFKQTVPAVILGIIGVIFATLLFKTYFIKRAEIMEIIDKMEE